MLKTYYLLTNPGIIIGNLITTAAAFVLGSAGHFNTLLFLYTLAGLGCMIAFTCVFNNYIDRHLDQKMARTKNRAFATGSISVAGGLAFAVALGILGLTLLALHTNLLALSVASLGFFVYVIASGRPAPATPPLSAASRAPSPPSSATAPPAARSTPAPSSYLRSSSSGKCPTFFSIALYRFDDYAAASIPVLPVEKGSRVTKIHIVLYMISFILASSLLLVFGYTGIPYLVITTLLGLAWLALCLKGSPAPTTKSGPGRCSASPSSSSPRFLLRSRSFKTFLYKQPLIF